MRNETPAASKLTTEMPQYPAATEQEPLLGHGAANGHPALIPTLRLLGHTVRSTRHQPVTDCPDTEFQEVICSVSRAIAAGVHPELIGKGSSGAYFCRDERGKIVGVFKPRDEEPYGRLNPKWVSFNCRLVASVALHDIRHHASCLHNMRCDII